MTGPLTGTGLVTATLTGVTFSSLLSGTDAGVYIGSFVGAVFYMLTDNDLSWWRKVGYFVISFLFGLIAADMSTEIIKTVIDSYLSKPPSIDKSIGATLAAAVVVRVLMWLTRLDMKTVLTRIISALSGGGNGNAK